MSNRISRGVVEFMGIFGSAISAAASVKQKRQPNAGDLRVLGIEPAQFRTIRRF